MGDLNKMAVYRKAFEYMVYIEQSVRNFSRYNKYSIGSELRKRARSMTLQFALFNKKKSHEKIAVLSELQKSVEEAKIELTLSRELLTFKKYEAWYHGAQILEEIGRQVDLLKRYFEKKAGIKEKSDE
ncbi:MAG: four helix bundle protein [bacterium]